MTQRDGMGREEGGGLGTHVYLWRIHFDIWQNQYNIVKLKTKQNKKKPSFSAFLSIWINKQSMQIGLHATTKIFTVLSPSPNPHKLCPKLACDFIWHHFFYLSWVLSRCVTLFLMVNKLTILHLCFQPCFPTFTKIPKSLPQIKKK